MTELSEFESLYEDIQNYIVKVDAPFPLSKLHSSNVMRWLGNPDPFPGSSNRERPWPTSQDNDQLLTDMQQNKLDPTNKFKNDYIGEASAKMSEDLQLNQQDTKIYISKTVDLYSSNVKMFEEKTLRRIKYCNRGNYGQNFAAYDMYFYDIECALNSIYLLMSQRHQSSLPIEKLKEITEYTNELIRGSGDAGGISNNNGIIKNIIDIICRQVLILSNRGASSTNNTINPSANTNNPNIEFTYWTIESIQHYIPFLCEILFFTVHDLQSTKEEAVELIECIRKLADLMTTISASVIQGGAMATGAYNLYRSNAYTSQLTFRVKRSHVPCDAVEWYRCLNLSLFRLQMCLTTMLSPRIEDGRFERTLDVRTMNKNNELETCHLFEASDEYKPSSSHQTTAAKFWQSCVCRAYVEMVVGRLLSRTDFTACCSHVVKSVQLRGFSYIRLCLLTTLQAEYTEHPRKSGMVRLFSDPDINAKDFYCSITASMIRRTVLIVQQAAETNAVDPEAGARRECPMIPLCWREYCDIQRLQQVDSEDDMIELSTKNIDCLDDLMELVGAFCHARPQFADYFYSSCTIKDRTLSEDENHGRIPTEKQNMLRRFVVMCAHLASVDMMESGDGTAGIRVDMVTGGNQFQRSARNENQNVNSSYPQYNNNNNSSNGYTNNQNNNQNIYNNNNNGSDNLYGSLGSSLARMLAGLAVGTDPMNAREVFNLMQGSLGQPSILDIESLFDNLEAYAEMMGAEPIVSGYSHGRAVGYQRDYSNSSPSMMLSISKQHELVAIIDLIGAVMKHPDSLDDMMNISKLMVLERLFNLLSTPIIVALKGSIFKTLSALANRGQFRALIWQQLEQYQIIPTIPGLNDINAGTNAMSIYDDLETERGQGLYPVTDGFLSLLKVLLAYDIDAHHGIGLGLRMPGVVHYLEYVINAILLDFDNFYTIEDNDADLYKIVARSLDILVTVIQRYGINQLSVSHPEIKRHQEIMMRGADAMLSSATSSNDYSNSYSNYSSNNYRNGNMNNNSNGSRNMGLRDNNSNALSLYLSPSQTHNHTINGGVSPSPSSSTSIELLASDFGEETFEYDVGGTTVICARPKSAGFTIMALLLQQDSRLLRLVVELMSDLGGLHEDSALCNSRSVQMNFISDLATALLNTSALRACTSNSNSSNKSDNDNNQNNTSNGLGSAVSNNTNSSNNIVPVKPSKFRYETKGSRYNELICDRSYWRERCTVLCMSLLYEVSMREQSFVDIARLFPRISIMSFSGEGRQPRMVPISNIIMVDDLSKSLLSMESLQENARDIAAPNTAVSLIASYMGMFKCDIYSSYHSLPSMPVMATKLLRHISMHVRHQELLNALKEMDNGTSMSLRSDNRSRINESSSYSDTGYSTIHELTQACAVALSEVGTRRGIDELLEGMATRLIPCGADLEPGIFTSPDDTSCIAPPISWASLEKALADVNMDVSQELWLRHYYAQSTLRDCVLELLLSNLCGDRVSFAQYLLGLSGIKSSDINGHSFDRGSTNVTIQDRTVLDALFQIFNDVFETLTTPITPSDWVINTRIWSMVVEILHRLSTGIYTSQIVINMLRQQPLCESGPDLYPIVNPNRFVSPTWAGRGGGVRRDSGFLVDLLSTSVFIACEIADRCQIVGSQMDKPVYMQARSHMQAACGFLLRMIALELNYYKSMSEPMEKLMSCSIAILLNTKWGHRNSSDTLLVHMLSDSLMPQGEEHRAWSALGGGNYSQSERGSHGFRSNPSSSATPLLSIPLMHRADEYEGRTSLVLEKLNNDAERAACRHGIDRLYVQCASNARCLRQAPVGVPTTVFGSTNKPYSSDNYYSDNGNNYIFSLISVHGLSQCLKEVCHDDTEFLIALGLSAHDNRFTSEELEILKTEIESLCLKRAAEFNINQQWVANACHMYQGWVQVMQLSTSLASAWRSAQIAIVLRGEQSWIPFENTNLLRLMQNVMIPLVQYLASSNTLPVSIGETLVEGVTASLWSLLDSTGQPVLDPERYSTLLSLILKLIVQTNGSSVIETSRTSAGVAPQQPASAYSINVRGNLNLALIILLQYPDAFGTHSHDPLSKICASDGLISSADLWTFAECKASLIQQFLPHLSLLARDATMGPPTWRRAALNALRLCILSQINVTTRNNDMHMNNNNNNNNNNSSSNSSNSSNSTSPSIWDHRLASLEQIVLEMHSRDVFSSFTAIFGAFTPSVVANYNSTSEIVYGDVNTGASDILQSTALMTTSHDTSNFDGNMIYESSSTMSQNKKRLLDIKSNSSGNDGTRSHNILRVAVDTLCLFTSLAMTQQGSRALIDMNFLHKLSVCPLLNTDTYDTSSQGNTIANFSKQRHFSISSEGAKLDSSYCFSYKLEMIHAILEVSQAMISINPTEAANIEVLKFFLSQRRLLVPMLMLVDPIYSSNLSLACGNLLSSTSSSGTGGGPTSLVHLQAATGVLSIMRDTLQLYNSSYFMGIQKRQSSSLSNCINAMIGLVGSNSNNNNYNYNNNNNDNSNSSSMGIGDGVPNYSGDNGISAAESFPTAIIRLLQTCAVQVRAFTSPRRVAVRMTHTTAAPLSFCTEANTFDSNTGVNINTDRRNVRTFHRNSEVRPEGDLMWDVLMPYENISTSNEVSNDSLSSEFNDSSSSSQLFDNQLRPLQRATCLESSDLESLMLEIPACIKSGSCTSFQRSRWTTYDTKKLRVIVDLVSTICMTIKQMTNVYRKEVQKEVLYSPNNDETSRNSNGFGINDVSKNENSSTASSGDRRSSNQSKMNSNSSSASSSSSGVSENSRNASSDSGSKNTSDNKDNNIPDSSNSTSTTITTPISQMHGPRLFGSDVAFATILYTLHSICNLALEMHSEYAASANRMHGHESNRPCDADAPVVKGLCLDLCNAANNLATVCYDCTFCMSATVANRWQLDVQLVTNIAQEFLPGCYLVVVLDRVRKIFEGTQQ